MSVEDRIREIARTILTKSQRDQIQWIKRENPTRVGGATGQTAWVNFTNSAFAITYVSPEALPDYYMVQIFKADGLDEVGRLNAFQEREERNGEISQDWTLMKSLWEEAQRSLLGWDKVLYEMESQLKSPGKVGAVLPNKPK